MPNSRPDNPAPESPKPELAVLWVQAQSAVSAFIRSSVRDGHVADDLLQRVALIATREFEQYDHSRPFTPWLIGIAKMQVLSYFRDQGREKLHFDESLLAKIADAHAEAPGGSGSRLEALESCIQRLQAKSRSLIELRYLRQLPINQIAERSGLTPLAVRSALHRVRNALYRCITAKLKQEGDL